MKLVSRLFKPCLLLIAFFTLNLQTQAAAKHYKKADLAQMTIALDAFDHEIQSAYGVWQIVEYDLSSGQAPTSQTKQQLQFVIASLSGMSDEIDNMANAAKSLGHEHIMQDVNNIKLQHASTVSAAKTLLNGILKGYVDYAAVSNVSGGFDMMERLIDCIRREIQVITGGK
jgi:hypothetical protein